MYSKFRNILDHDLNEFRIENFPNHWFWMKIQQKNFYNCVDFRDGSPLKIVGLKSSYTASYHKYINAPEKFQQTNSSWQRTLVTPIVLASGVDKLDVWLLSGKLQTLSCPSPIILRTGDGCCLVETTINLQKKQLSRVFHHQKVHALDGAVS